MSACIYCIENKINNHCYIGQTVNFSSRISKHFCELRKGQHCNIVLQRAFDKYGEENFKTYIIEEILDYSIIGEREKYWIEQKGYYNIDKGREGFTPLALKNMSEAHIGQKNPRRLIQNDEEALEFCAILEFCECSMKPLSKLTPYSQQVFLDLKRGKCYKDIKEKYVQMIFSERLQLLKKGIKKLNYDYWKVKPNASCPLKNRFIDFLIKYSNLNYEKIGNLIQMTKGGIRKANSEIKNGLREINTTYSDFQILQILKILLDNNTVLSTIKISESVETN